MQEKYAVNSRKFKYDVTANGKTNFSPSVFSRLYTYVFAFTVNKGFLVFFYCWKRQQKQSSYLPFAVCRCRKRHRLFIFYKSVVSLAQAKKKIVFSSLERVQAKG